MNRVVPHFESLPKRVYTYDGETVICREIISFPEEAYSSFKPKDSIKTGKELFRLSLSKDKAEMLMNDLYYGEYTGG